MIRLAVTQGMLVVAFVACPALSDQNVVISENVAIPKNVVIPKNLALPENVENVNIRALIAAGDLNAAEQAVTNTLQVEPVDWQTRYDQVLVGTALLSTKSDDPVGIQWIAEGVTALCDQEPLSAPAATAISQGLRGMEQAARDADQFRACQRLARVVVDRLRGTRPGDNDTAYSDALRTAVTTLMRLDQFSPAKELIQNEWNAHQSRMASGAGDRSKGASIATVAVQTMYLLDMEFVEGLVEKASAELLDAEPSREALAEFVAFERRVLLALAQFAPARCETRLEKLEMALEDWWPAFERNVDWRWMVTQIRRIIQSTRHAEKLVGEDGLFNEFRELLRDPDSVQFVGGGQKGAIEVGRPHLILLWSADRPSDLQNLQQLSSWNSSNKLGSWKLLAVSRFSNLEWSETRRKGVRSRVVREDSRARETTMLETLRKEFSSSSSNSITNSTSNSITFALAEKYPASLSRSVSSSYLAFGPDGNLLAVVPAEAQSLPFITSSLLNASR
jgi:hypothetical protein